MMNKKFLKYLIPVKRKDQKRLFIDLAIIGVVFGIYCWYTHLAFEQEVETEHYKAFTNASIEDTKVALDKVELLYHSYTTFWDVLPENKNNKLLLKVYASRKEFKRYNPLMTWAEAYYNDPYCHQYIDSESKTKEYFWMIHEATHQLNNEVSKMKLPQLADEGIACYFSTSIISNGKLNLGIIDDNTYPMWWVNNLDLCGDIKSDIASDKIMSIKHIINNINPLNVKMKFNLYYVHWFSLVHFLIEGKQGAYREAFMTAAQTPSGLKKFEQNIGPYSQIELEWYAHLRQMINN